MQQAFQIANRQMYQREKPVRDPKFLKFVRILCCIVCGSYRYVEAAHFGPRGLGQKADDTDALPLCHKCHQVGPHLYHVLGARRFVAFHNLNVAVHQQECREGYQQLKRAA